MFKNSSFRGFFLVLMFGLMIFSPNTAFSKSPVYSSYFGNIAINGTDTVAYFTEGKAIDGSPEFTYQWNDANWQFSTAKNRDTFAANPKKYAPQFGGYCAWAVSQGYTASTIPEAWTIVDGKLYLNYSRTVRSQWSEDIPGNITKAEQNWPRVLGN